MLRMMAETELVQVAAADGFRCLLGSKWRASNHSMIVGFVACLQRRGFDAYP